MCAINFAHIVRFWVWSYSAAVSSPRHTTYFVSVPEARLPEDARRGVRTRAAAAGGPPREERAAGALLGAREPRRGARRGHTAPLPPLPVRVPQAERAPLAPRARAPRVRPRRRARRRPRRLLVHLLVALRPVRRAAARRAARDPPAHRHGHSALRAGARVRAARAARSALQHQALAAARRPLGARSRP